MTVPFYYLGVPAIAALVLLFLLLKEKFDHLITKDALLDHRKADLLDGLSIQKVHQQDDGSVFLSYVSREGEGSGVLYPGHPNFDNWRGLAGTFVSVDRRQPHVAPKGRQYDVFEWVEFFYWPPRQTHLYWLMENAYEALCEYKIHGAHCGTARVIAALNFLIKGEMNPLQEVRVISAMDRWRSSFSADAHIMAVFNEMETYARLKEMRERRQMFVSKWQGAP